MILKWDNKECKCKVVVGWCFGKKKPNHSQRWFRNENTQCRLTFGTVRATPEMDRKILNDSSVRLHSVDLN